MALNDIKVPRENSGGTFDEVVLTGTQIGLEKPATGNASSTQVVLGNDTRLSDARTPSSTLAHAASHAAGGSDPMAPSDIGAQSIFSTESPTWSSDLTLTASRAKQYNAIVTATSNITLPTSGHQVGDVVVIYRIPTGSGTLTIRRGNPFISTWTVNFGEQFRWRATGTGNADWELVQVDTHTHPASAISDSTTAGRALLTGADAAAQRTTLGLGTAAVEAASAFAQASHSHELTALAATGASNGHVLTANGSNGVTFAALPASGVTGAASSASDVLGVSGANITGVDAGSDKIVFWDDSASALKYLEAGSGLSISGTTLTATATGTIGGGTGSVDNALLRADGTGGVTAQSSALVIDDAVVPFSITGDAGTDIITAVGHPYTANQVVRFPTLTGGSGLTAATTNYFVRDISGDTFKVSTTSGGGAVNFTTNITAGTIVAIEAGVTIQNTSSASDSSVTITPKGAGAFILGPKPDATSVGGNRRGQYAVDLQMVRTASDRVASGESSAIIGGDRHTASGARSAVLGGRANVASSTEAVALGGQLNTASGGGAIAGGDRSVASGSYSVAFGSLAGADRQLMAFASGGFTADAGVSQRVFATLRCKTTTNAAVEMAIDGATTYFTIPSGKVIFCNIKVVGVKSDGAVVATYERQYAAKNFSGTSSQVFAPVTIGTDNASGTSLEVATVDQAGAATDYIRIRPTGIASETWRWVASVDAVECIYGT